MLYGSGWRGTGFGFRAQGSGPNTWVGKLDGQQVSKGSYMGA